jgi:hypothetical protein
MKWIQLAHDLIKQRAIMKMEINILPCKEGYFLDIWATHSFSRKTVTDEISCI